MLPDIDVPSIAPSSSSTAHPSSPNSGATHLADALKKLRQVNIYIYYVIIYYKIL